MKYLITVKEAVLNDYIVEAKSEDEARDKLEKDQYDSVQEVDYVGLGEITSVAKLS